MVEKVALGQVFSEYFSFPCQFAFHQLLHNHHHLSSGAGTTGQTVATVPRGLSLTVIFKLKYWGYTGMLSLLLSYFIAVVEEMPLSNSRSSELS
jgi:hypothetical protein